MRYHLYSVIFLLIIIPKIFCLIPERVILSTDNNPLYIQFWPLVAKTWKEVTGIKPTLALVADDDVTVDETVGEVIRFKPIPGIPNSYYAQVVRLLLPPALYPDEVCILSDIDMLPLSKVFFLKCAAHVPDDHFVVYTDAAYGEKKMQYPICYNAAKGSVFREIIGISSLEEIPAKIHEWIRFRIGWISDEIILYGLLHLWNADSKRLTRLGYNTGNQRIDRGNWKYDKNLLAAGYYVDSHMLRPYNHYRIPIDMLVDDLHAHHHLFYRGKPS